MPTNFKISYQPTFRYVTAEPCLVANPGPAVSGFTRWRHIERLVIHTGPEVTVTLPGLPAGLASALAELRGAFPK